MVTPFGLSTIARDGRPVPDDRPRRLRTGNAPVNERRGRSRTLPSRGPVAQLVEQGTFNPKVAGSRPARPIRNCLEMGEILDVRVFNDVGMDSRSLRRHPPSWPPGVSAPHPPSVRRCPWSLLSDECL